MQSFVHCKWLAMLSVAMFHSVPVLNNGRQLCAKCSGLESDLHWSVRSHQSIQHRLHFLSAIFQLKVDDDLQQRNTGSSPRRQTSSRCRHLANWTKHSLRVVFDYGQFASLCENVASSTKPEVYNVLHCRQKDQATAKCKTCRKFGEIWTCDF